MIDDMISPGVVELLDPSDGVEKVCRFRCSFCTSEYDDRAAALECFARGFESHIKIGDILVGNRKYGWVEGDAPHWIYDHTNDCKKDKSHLSFGYRFYFVAVAITHDEREGDKNYRLHYPIIHYVTNAMRDQGRHSTFSLWYGRHYYKDDGCYSGGPLPVLPEKPKNNSQAFKPRIQDVPKRVREEAAELLENKKCSCAFAQEHQAVGWVG